MLKPGLFQFRPCSENNSTYGAAETAYMVYRVRTWNILDFTLKKFLSVHIL